MRSAKKNQAANFVAIALMFAVVGTAAYPQNYYPPTLAEPARQPSDGLVMDYEPDIHLSWAARGKPVVNRDPVYLTNEANPQAVAEVQSRKRTVANAA